MRKKIRLLVSVLLVVATLAFGVYFIAGHRDLVTQLKHTPPLTILWVLLLDVVMFGVLLLVLGATLRVCARKLPLRENVLLNAYMLFINFFIPGQGGPAFRGVYMLRRHQLKVRYYVAATLFYYMLYGIVGIFLLLLGSLPWWQTAVAVCVMAATGVAAMKLYARHAKLQVRELRITRATVLYLLAATILQALVQVVIYVVELHSSGTHVGLGQALIYTGAANLALFVGLTPGAIGIRESFLVFTEHLHHISSGSIVVANVIDRSVYLIFLLALVVVTLSLHAKEKLQVRQVQAAIKKEA